MNGPKDFSKNHLSCVEHNEVCVLKCVYLRCFFNTHIKYFSFISNVKKTCLIFILLVSLKVLGDATAEILSDP
jgi:hypothetical protein